MGKVTRGCGSLLDNLSSRAHRIPTTNVVPRQSSIQRTMRTQGETSEPFTPPTKRCPNDVGMMPPCTQSFPENLRLKNLLWTQDGVILWDSLRELASLELLFHLHLEKDNAWDALSLLMQRKRVPMPSTFEPSELCAMSEKNKINAKRNINQARDDFFDHI